MTRRFAALVFALALCVPVFLLAHEGHDHKVLGTVVSVDAKQVVVKTAEGPEKTIMVSAATTFHKGKVKGVAADLKAGTRVVVNVGAGKEPLAAKDIEYAAPAATKTK
jgi:hypothetical protein